MPRRRVPPDQRQRSSKACEACRATKKRCNDQAPCSNCLRRGLASSCTNLEQLQDQQQDFRQPRGSVSSSMASGHALATSPHGPGLQHIVTPESVAQSIGGDVAAAGAALRPGVGSTGRRQDKIQKRLQFDETRTRSQQSTRPASPAGDNADADEAEHPRMLLSARGEKGMLRLGTASAG